MPPGSCYSEQTTRGIVRPGSDPACVDPAQFYETTVHNRDGRESFSFVTIPVRSIPSGIEAPDAVGTARLLGLREPRLGDEGAIALRPVEAWSLPFLLDAMLGRPLDDFGPWRDPFWFEDYLRGPRSRSGPSAFAQYLAYSPVVPFESSPLGPKALSELATAGGGVGAALGAYATGDPLLLLVVPAGIIVCGAARGVADALRIGLRSKLLELMGVEDPDRDASEPD